MRSFSEERANHKDEDGSDTNGLLSEVDYIFIPSTIRHAHRLFTRNLKQKLDTQMSNQVAPFFSYFHLCLFNRGQGILYTYSFTHTIPAFLTLH